MYLMLFYVAHHIYVYAHGPEAFHEINAIQTQFHSYLIISLVQVCINKK